MSNGEELVARIRDYACGRAASGPSFPGDGGVAVSSAWLAREFGVDPRTIAAALRPYGIRPAEVERGVRGYLIVDLAGLDLGEPDDDELGGLDGAFERTEVEGWGAADIGSDWRMVPSDARPVVSPSPLGGATDGVPADFQAAGAPSAVKLLSAGAGHDMTPALRAAGLL